MLIIQPIENLLLLSNEDSFRAIEHHRRLADTKLYCLVTAEEWLVLGLEILYQINILTFLCTNSSPSAIEVKSLCIQ